MYCERMMVSGKNGGMRELQAIADICFSVVECYSTENYLVPFHTIEPLRVQKKNECLSHIRLWIQAGHCTALIDYTSDEIIQNILDDEEFFSHSVSDGKDYAEPEEDQDKNEN